MKVALLCDVDQTVYHVGDEAIAAASTARLRARGHEVLRISRREKYGPGGAADPDALPALTFPWPLEQRATYLAEIRRVLAGDHEALPPSDKLFEIIRAMRAVDALVIGGGGSLTSRYGWLLDERLATALVARSLGKTVVLSGQSIGPELTDSDREQVTELLGLCALAGLRDPHSAALARALAPGHGAIHHTADDAIHPALLDGLAGRDPRSGELTALGAPESVDGAARERGGEPCVIAVTLAADTDPFPREDFLRIVAALVDELADRTGGRVELVPHMADPDDGGADEQIHEELAAILRTPVRALRAESATVSARRTATADIVVSTRFHPVVFGTLGGAAVLALPLNRYGAVRMDGALRTMGLGGGTVPLAGLWDPEGHGPGPAVRQAVDALLSGREQETRRLREARPLVLAAAEAWWDLVSEVLSGREPEAGPELPGRVEVVPRFLPDWAESLAVHVPPAQLEQVPPPAPAVSVVMRTRDRLRLLDRAVQDVLAQTRQDWELVVVDDAGDAEAVDAVVGRHLAEGAGRIRVIHREVSTGMEAASNAGVAATSAPVLAVHDDDDTWHATFLQETLARLDAQPALDAVVTRTLVVHEHETATGMVEDEVFPLWPQLAGVHLVDYIAVNRHVPISMAYRRRVHETVGLYDESLPVVGDYAFHLALLQHGEIGFLDRPLAQWRQRPRAAGAAANSMIAMGAEHRHLDAVLRERALQDWVRSNGPGLPMFVSHDTGAQLAAHEERMLQEFRALREQVEGAREELRTTRAELEQLQRRVRRLDPVAIAGRIRRRVLRRGRAADPEV